KPTAAPVPGTARSSVPEQRVCALLPNTRIIPAGEGVTTHFLTRANLFFAGCVILHAHGQFYPFSPSFPFLADPCLMTIALCPAQQTALDRLRRLAPLSPVLILHATHGHGKTAILQQMQQHLGGAYLCLADLIDFTRSRHPLALEETVTEWLTQV